MSIKLESNWIKILKQINTLDCIQGLLLENYMSNSDGRWSGEWIIELEKFKRYLEGLNNQDWRLFWDTGIKGKVYNTSVFFAFLFCFVLFLFFYQMLAMC